MDKASVGKVAFESAIHLSIHAVTVSLSWIDACKLY
jgi:hypothetical protein